MRPAIPKEMTPEEFLIFVEQHPDKHFDFIDGEMVEVSPKPLHGRKQADFTIALGAYTKQNPVGLVYTEVLHVLNGEKFIPDVCTMKPAKRIISPNRPCSLSKFAPRVNRKRPSVRRHATISGWA
jgi:Uma2 family endonuclease